MSLVFISQFQEKLYKILKQNELIKNMNVAVYFALQQDAKYPFIMINMLQSLNLSKLAIERYELDFEICIFVRDKAQDLLLKIASEVMKIITIEALASEQYNLVAINYNTSEWVRGQDLLTTKLVINYKALLQMVRR